MMAAILSVSLCPATSGIISAVTSFLSENNCYISELAQYDDEELGRLFLRAKFRFNKGVKPNIATLHNELCRHCANLRHELADPQHLSTHAGFVDGE